MPIHKKFPGISGRQVTVQIGAITRIDPTVRFGPKVTIGNNVLIGRGCSIGGGSHIGDGTTIRAHVTLGERVHLSGGGLARARSHIGARSAIYMVSIGERVVIGAHARCNHVAIEDGAVIGDWFFGDAFHYKSPVTIKPQVIIHDNVTVKGPITIGGYGGKTIIGESTRLTGQLVIKGYVTIGKECNIETSDIEIAARIGDSVKLLRAHVRLEARIGSHSQVEYAEVGRWSEVGERVIVRSHANVPEGWLIPDDTVVNPNPALGVPTVITRAPRPCS